MDKLDKLKEIGTRLLAVAHEYHRAAREAEIGGAVIWLQDTSGKLVIITRGEYREQLMRGIENVGPTHHFGSTADEDKPVEARGMLK